MANFLLFFFKQKTAYEIVSGDWSSDVCSSDLTREELESAIRLEMEDISEWPTDLAISVVPHEDSWKVEIMRDGPQHDADRCEMIEAIADRLRNQFDLKD